MNSSSEQLLELLEACGPELHRLLVRITHSQHAAEDLLQDLFLKLHGGNCRTGENARAYLRKAAINAAFDWRRRQSIRRHDSISDVTLSEPGNVEREIERQEEVERVLDALEHLPRLQRDVIVLRYFQSEDFERIGSLLGKTTHHVRSILHKGLKKLRRSLNQQSGTP